MTTDFEEKLEKYAELIVKVGLNLQPGQRILIRALSLDVAPLVRKVTACAYQHGSRLVSVQWVDEHLERIRYQFAPHDSFEEFPVWETEGTIKCAERGDALLIVEGKNPELLKDQNPELVTIATRTGLTHSKPIYDHIWKNSGQWSMISPPTQDWAKKVFPKDTPQDAEARLWDAVSKTCGLDHAEPVPFWQKKIEDLGKRRDYLTTKKYSALQFVGPDTSLKIGLPDGHIWCGGNVNTPSGITFLPNIPTEEVFTMPHKYKVDGRVTATKPLAYQGNLVENFNLTFSKGKVVSFSAGKGEETLRHLLETDDGAKYLGEVALVPHKTPISQLDIVFLNIGYDENASNHLALGNAYRFCVEGGEAMSDEEFAQIGGNDSLTHVDFMFGSGEMDVDGLKEDGLVEPVMREGDWAFDV